MRLEMHGRQADWTEALRRHAERRLHFALGRFSPRIGRVTVDIGDGGPCADPRKVYRVAVMLTPRGRIDVEDGGDDHFSAISRLADQAGRMVGRALDRERNGLHIPSDRREPKVRGPDGAPSRSSAGRKRRPPSPA